MRPDLVTIGGLTVDNVVAADGTVALNKAGGNGAYSAVGALFFAKRVGLVSHAVASYPKDVIERLRLGGVDLGGVVWSQAELTSCSWFLYDGLGRREEGLSSPPEALAAAGLPTNRLAPHEVATWRRLLKERVAPGEITYSAFRTAHPLKAEQVPQEWLDTRGVHLAPSHPDVMVAMLDRFAGHGALVTADPGWQLAERRLEEIAPILSRLDAFLPSEVEIKELLPGAGLADALQTLADICPGAVAVKLGPDGVLVHNRMGTAPTRVPTVRVAATDPTGAGDAFCGGFLAGLLETRDPVGAARFGVVAASRIVRAFGADGALPVDRNAARSALAATRLEFTP